MWNVPLFQLNFDEAERQAADAVIQSGWLTMGERVIEFEASFSSAVVGGAPCVAVTNCTAALHLALLAAGVGPGDEVILPAVTFVADANVVRMCGATPVLADLISTDDLTIDPDDVARRITHRTKAVIAVHFAGYACDMESLARLCRAKGIVLIEDVAHAPGGTCGDLALGGIGDIGCFSFFSNKNLSTGEGGMACSRRPELFDRLRLLRSHGMTTLTLDRHQGRAFSYDVTLPGLNYRMDEIHAALGIAQLAKLPAANERRREIVRRYRERLSGSSIEVPFKQWNRGTHTGHIMPVLLPRGCDRHAVMSGLKARGIQSSIHYPPFWSFSAYHDFDPRATPLAADVGARELTLPLYPTMSNEQIDLVCSALIEVTPLPSR